MAYTPSKEEVMQATGQTPSRRANSGYALKEEWRVWPNSAEIWPNFPIYEPNLLAISGIHPLIWSYWPVISWNYVAEAISQHNHDQPQDACQSYFSKVPDLNFNLNESDVAAFGDELKAYQAIYAPFYKRREQREHGANYLHGLLLKIDNKSIENMALELFGANQNLIRNMQHFISDGVWDDEAILKQHWMQVQTDLADNEGVLTVDGSDFPKQGSDSAGVKRQYCGQLGKIANCQAGVFVGYTGENGYCLLDRRLYLPEDWLSEQMQQKRKSCGIAEGMEFKTKPELALEMLVAIDGEKTLSAQWVTADEAFGRASAFLDGVADLGLWYFAEVPHNSRVWQESVRVEIPPWSGHGKKPTKKRVVEGEPEALTVAQIAKQIAEEEWSRQTIKEGSKGPIIADFAFRRVFEVRDGLPRNEVWLVIRRTASEIKTYLSNAPADISLDKLVRVSGQRWPIETCFEEAKQLLGMGDYQVRSWRGWHHHMTLVILAHFFLIRVRRRNRDQAFLSTAQVQLLLHPLLPKVPCSVQNNLIIVTYRQHRNRAAYLSYRKRRLEKEKRLAT